MNLIREAQESGTLSLILILVMIVAGIVVPAWREMNSWRRRK